MRDHIATHGRHDLQVLVVSFSEPASARDYMDYLELPFPVSADPERSAYAAYGMLSGSAWQVWHPRTIWKYIVMAARGTRPRRPSEGADLSQLGGDFIIDGGGRVRFAHSSARPDDRPSVERLVAVLDRLGEP